MIKPAWLACIGALSIGSWLIVLIVLTVQITSLPFILPIQRQPVHPDVVLVLGAGLTPSGAPSDALADRLRVGEAVSRYVEAPMLLTGDDGEYRRAEIPAMQRWLLDRRVAPDRIVIDEQGYRTYESCKRAAQTFHLKKVIIITQRFHLARAIYLCRSFGIESYGLPADLQSYQEEPWFITRDILASVKAWLDIHFLHPKSPVEDRYIGL